MIFMTNCTFFYIQFLELTCTSCFRLLVKPIERYIFEINLKLLDNELDYLLQVVKELSVEPTELSKDDDTDQIKYVRAKLEEANIFKLIEQKEKEKLSSPDSSKNNRNVVELKSNLVKAFLQKRPISFLKKCPTCQAKRPRYSLLNAAIYNSVKEDTTNDSKALDELFLNKITENVDGGKKHIHPLLVRVIFRKLWSYEKDFLSKLLKFYDFNFSSLITENNEKLDELDYLFNNVLDQNEDLYGTKCPFDVFFNEYILVSPTRFRPLRHMDDRTYEAPKSTRLNLIVTLANQLSKLYNLLVNTENLNQSISIDLSRRKKQYKSNKNAANSINRDVAVKSFYKIWNDLQMECCFLFDSEMVKGANKSNVLGFKQLIEKKEGLFRKNIMGKRVNYAARSVISPGI